MRPLCLLLAGLLCAVAIPSAARTLAEVRDSGTLRICVAGSSAAFYQANGEAFARFLGVTPEVRRLESFDEQFHNARGVTERDQEYEPRLLADGTCDVFPNDLHIVDWRESKMLLVPYYSVRSVVLARADSRSTLRSVEDLGGRTAAVQKGTSYDAWLARANAQELASRPVKVIYAPTAESVRLVAEGKADFTLVGTEGAIRWSREDRSLAVLFSVDEQVKVGWGVRPVAKRLSQELARFFEEGRRPGSELDRNWREQYLVSLGEYELYEAAFSEGKFDLREFLRWALPALLVSALLFAATILWNRRLKAEIRQRVAAEDALRSANAELREAKRVAEEATNAKSMFLASMSHEIRTPMNGVLGMLRLLAFSRLDAQQKATLDGARDSAGSLMRIIDDLLDFSKIEAGKLEIRPEAASVAAIVEGVGRRYSGLASAKDLLLTTSVEAAISPALEVDPLRLGQILNNFVSNAIKFTRQGSVAVAAALVERRDGHEVVRFSVNDTGIGVSKEAQERLFQPYAQAAVDTARQFGGTGLGLSICRRLADMMGGMIAMESAPGRGTTMTLTLRLPVADPADLPQADAAEAGAALIGLRRPAPAVAAAEAEGSLVLVAEDHPTNRAVMTRYLGLLGYAAVTADNGRAALERWQSGRFGAVITDCNMPELDGYGLARAIRERESAAGRPRTPVIACTANAQAEEIGRCTAAGMDDFVVKPVDLELLAKVMDRWLPLATAPVDRASLAAIGGSDPESEREILTDFTAANDADMATLRKGLADRDILQVTQASHRIKGACLTIGAKGLADVCARMESAGRGSNWPAIAAEQEALEREFARLNAWLLDQGKRG